jgi:hypothetical protein
MPSGQTPPSATFPERTNSCARTLSGRGHQARQQRPQAAQFEEKYHEQKRNFRQAHGKPGKRDVVVFQVAADQTLGQEFVKQPWFAAVASEQH